MDNIICYTNILFDIANGNIQSENIVRLRLIGTDDNVVEIALTPNLVKNIFSKQASYL